MLRETDDVLVKVGALDQARAVRRAIAILEALDGATVEFEPLPGGMTQPVTRSEAGGPLTGNAPTPAHCPSMENPCMCRCHLTIECFDCRMGRHVPKVAA